MKTTISLGPNETKHFISEGISEIKIESAQNLKFGVNTGSGAFDFNATYTDNKGVELIDFNITNLSGDCATYDITTDTDITETQPENDKADKAAEKPAP